MNPERVARGGNQWNAQWSRGPENTCEWLLTERVGFAKLASGMKFILSTHNVTLTEAIEQHILARIEKLDHLDPRAISARVTLEHDHQKVPERQFKCSMRIEEPGPDLYAEDSESDLYAAIDLVTKKVEQQIRKRRGKFKVRNHTEAAKGKRKRQGVAAA